jgi:beta-lactamase class A
MRRRLAGVTIAIAIVALALLVIATRHRSTPPAPGNSLTPGSSSDTLADKEDSAARPNSASTKTGHALLEQRVIEQLGKARGTYEVAIYDFQTGDSTLVDAHVPLHAASLIKLPVMMAAFSLIDSGALALSEEVVVKREYKSLVDDSHFRVAPVVRLPESASVRRLLRAMITVSDNIAANTLMERIGIDRIGEFLAGRGYAETHLVRFLMDERAFRQRQNNTMSAYDAMRMLRDIEQGRGFSAESRAEMLDLLLGQTNNDKIPAALPSGVSVAHKTGHIGGVEHDAGIVYLPSGSKYIIAFESTNLPSNQTGIEVARSVSLLAYKHFSGLRSTTKSQNRP